MLGTVTGDGVGVTAADGESPAGADDFAARDQEVAHRWRQQVDLQFHGQHASRRSHQTQRRIAARAIERGDTAPASRHRLPIWHCRCGSHDGSGKMRGMHDHLLIAVYALAGVAAIEAAAIGVLWRLLVPQQRLKSRHCSDNRTC